MLTIKSLTLKNFLSIGNVTQSISFHESELYLIIGENLDLGGNDNRNGVGKTSIINGLSYALFGKSLVNIKLENLINKTNAKHMAVSIEFEKDGIPYRIERGRKPQVLKFYVNDEENENDDSDDNEAQGENRLTQAEIERTLGFSHNMFKNIIALNTYTVPFLSSPAADQRDIIEQLLGVTKLSEKSEILKELLKTTKENLQSEEFRISAVKEANKRIQENIKKQERSSLVWETSHKKSLSDINDALTTLLDIDIDAEIEKHETIAHIKETKAKKSAVGKEIDSLRREESRSKALLLKSNKSLDVTNTKVCHTCGQSLSDESHKELSTGLEGHIEEVQGVLESCKNDIREKQEIFDEFSIPEEPVTFYNSIAEAYNHKSSIHSLESSLLKEKESTNPYIENIKNLTETGLQEIDYETIDELSTLKDHQEFLLKLLTSKDSFIRKKIINQNLMFLNNRLETYLEKMGLPHHVVFLPDLTVEIQEHGRDLDFDNLSRGERTRLILSLSWAFRDVYESLNDKINLLFIDELVDNGLDINGVESALKVLKRMTREDHRCVHLISHRDELVGRVDNVLKVVKEAGFTSFDLSDEL